MRRLIGDNPGEMMKQGKVYIVIVNYNGWQDTVECLESVFRTNDNLNYRVIVCDNDSKDASLDRIKEWAEGKILAPVKSRYMAHFSRPHVPKPISYSECNRATAERGGNKDEDPPLLLFRTGGNLGFAGGNNVGLRYALARADFSHVWLLNNDTVVERDTLNAMIHRVQISPDIGMCGSTVCYYFEPESIQTLGGARYNKWRCRPEHIRTLSKAEAGKRGNEVEKKMNYVFGASMLVSKEFLMKIGLLSEDYFLYYEEFDWAQRAKGKFVLGYASDSVVYHKGGASIGRVAGPQITPEAVAYLQRSRIRFFFRYKAYAIPFLYMNLLREVLGALLRGHFSLAWATAQAMVGIGKAK